MKNAVSFSLARQRGLTLVEMLISTALLMMIMAMGTAIFSNIQSHANLAEKEARMQQYARDAMNKISRELRQAVGPVLKASSNTSDAYPDDIIFVVPNVTAAGTMSGYNQVRYWFSEDHEKPGSNIKSLYRAVRNIGSTPTNSNTPFTNNRTRLIREAAAENPGVDSFFEIEPKGKAGTILIKLRVAVYRVSRTSTGGVYEVERNFDMSTLVDLRNKL